MSFEENRYSAEEILDEISDAYSEITGRELPEGDVNFKKNIGHHYSSFIEDVCVNLHVAIPNVANVRKKSDLIKYLQENASPDVLEADLAEQVARDCDDFGISAGYLNSL